MTAVSETSPATRSLNPGTGAHPADKARVYAELRLHLTYQPAQQTVRAEAQLDSHEYGATGRVRGATGTVPPRPELNVETDLLVGAAR